MDKPKNRSSEDRLSAAGWGLFFAWAGVCLLTEMAWGGALLGVAVIVLGIQAARVATRLSVEWFWVLVGAGFATGGAWDLAGLAVPYFPIVLIVVGTAVTMTALLGHRRHRYH